MKITFSHLIALLLILLIVWSTVSAPVPLPETNIRGANADIPIQDVFSTIAAENDVVRTLYTKQIVGAGKMVGLHFDERWEDEGVDAGPLPALFLSKAGASLAQQEVQLELLLGSHMPITPTNAFKGDQIARFEKILSTRQPEFFKDSRTHLEMAMFPDIASVHACVNCHNDHIATPKTDWKLNDVMGATTWSYPHATVGEAEYLQIVAAARTAFREAYRSYLQKIETFENKPEIGDKWPEEGYCIPDEETFMAAFEAQASAVTMNRLLGEQ